MTDFFNFQNTGYAEAGASRKKKALRGFTAKSGDAHSDIDINNRTLRQRARMLYMSSPIATSAIKTNRTNVVGVGLKLKSRIDREYLGMTKEQAKQWQKQCEREFALWAEKKSTCDAAALNNFYELQQLVLISSLMSGDVFALMKHVEDTPLSPYGLRIQLVEADRVATPSYDKTFNGFITKGKNPDNQNTIYDGVEVDKNGKVVAYHICNKNPDEFYTDKNHWTRVQAYGEKTKLPNILQFFEAERPEQYRGVSILAQVIEPVLQLRRYTDSEIDAAIIESFFTAFIRTEATTPDTGNPFNETEEDDQVSSDPNDYEMGPGTVNILKPGEDIVFGDPKRPGGGFPGFVKAFTELIGAATEIPSDLLMKSFNSSYSASRAALLEAWKTFKMRRTWLISDFCQPIYEIWLSEAVARERISAPGFFTDPARRAAYLKADWVGPTQGQLDPVKEVKAEIMAVEQGFSTREQSTIKLNGGEWESNAEELSFENELLSKTKPQKSNKGGA